MSKARKLKNKIRDRLGTLRESTGAVALIMTLVLMTLSTVIILFAANFGVLYNKSVSNLRQAHVAFEASQAGMSVGIDYLRTNSSAILENSAEGYLQPYSDSITTNVTLANNSSYTITYSNPIQNNFDLIEITSTGTSPDNSATRTITQLVEYGSMLLNRPDRPVITTGAILMDDIGAVVNITNDNTILSGSTVTLTEGAFTLLDTGVSSDAAVTGSDIVQNDPTLSTQSDADLFSSYFGLPSSMVQASAGYSYTNDASVDYTPTLNGVRGATIWINQTSGNATFNNIGLIGSFSEPVLMVIDGDAAFTGATMIIGFVYVTGQTIEMGGITTIIGGFSSPNDVYITDSAQIIYSNTALTNLQDSANNRYYARVPGSWKDF